MITRAVVADDESDDYLHTALGSGDVGDPLHGEKEQDTNSMGQSKLEMGFSFHSGSHFDPIVNSPHHVSID